MRGTGALSGPPGRRRGKNLLSFPVVFQAVVFPCLIFSQKSWRKVWIGRKNWLIFAPAFGPGTVLGHGGKDEGGARFFDTDETRKDKQRRASGMFFCGTPGSPGEDNENNKRDTYNAEFDPGSG